MHPWARRAFLRDGHPLIGRTVRLRDGPVPSAGPKPDVRSRPVNTVATPRASQRSALVANLRPSATSRGEAQNLRAPMTVGEPRCDTTRSACEHT
jgi:hypothetical protein